MAFWVEIASKDLISYPLCTLQSKLAHFPPRPWVSGCSGSPGPFPMGRHPAHSFQRRQSMTGTALNEPSRWRSMSLRCYSKNKERVRFVDDPGNRLMKTLLQYSTWCLGCPCTLHLFAKNRTWRTSFGTSPAKIDIILTNTVVLPKNGGSPDLFSYGDYWLELANYMKQHQC